MVCGSPIRSAGIDRCAVAGGPIVHADELKLIVAVPMTGVVKDLGSQFERSSRHSLAMTFVSGPTVKQEFDAGRTYDLAISITPVIDSLIKDGKLLASTRCRYCLCRGRSGRSRRRAEAGHQDGRLIQASAAECEDRRSFSNRRERRSFQEHAAKTRDYRSDAGEAEADAGRHDRPGGSERTGGNDRGDGVGHPRAWRRARWAGPGRNCNSTTRSPRPIGSQSRTVRRRDANSSEAAARARGGS